MFGLDEEIVPNRSSKRATSLLYLYLLIFAFVAIGKAFCLGLRDIFSDLLAGMVLFLGAATYNHWMTTFFIFMTMPSVFDYISRLGLTVQRSTSLFSKTRSGLANIAMLFGLCVYAAGWWMVFEGYKEYKALAYGLPDPKTSEHSRLRPGSAADEEDEHKPLHRDYGSNNGPFAAFSGPGVRIGDNN